MVQIDAPGFFITMHARDVAQGRNCNGVVVLTITLTPRTSCPDEARLVQHIHLSVNMSMGRTTHMRSGRAGRPIMYNGLLISPDALRISTYNKPPCAANNC